MAEGEQASITALPASVEELVKLRAGSRVAVLDFLGSLCPITLGHVACLREARSVLCGLTPPLNEAFATGRFAPFAACVACVCVNSDRHVQAKLAAKGEQSLSVQQRLHLCQLATQHERWICADNRRPTTWVTQLACKYPHLTFTIVALNGADDVLTYSKWRGASEADPQVAIGRAGDTSKLIEASRGAKGFLIGQEGRTSRRARHAGLSAGARMRLPRGCWPLPWPGGSGSMGRGDRQRPWHTRRLCPTCSTTRAFPRDASLASTGSEACSTATARFPPTLRPWRCVGHQKRPLRLRLRRWSRRGESK